MFKTELEPDVSIVIPCLNEAKTIGAVVRQANNAFSGKTLRVEIIVSDNGSTDGSQTLAREAGASVIVVALRGYGAALQAGFAAARAPVILLAMRMGRMTLVVRPRWSIAFSLPMPPWPWVAA